MVTLHCHGNIRSDVVGYVASVLVVGSNTERERIKRIIQDSIKFKKA